MSLLSFLGLDGLFGGGGAPAGLMAAPQADPATGLTPSQQKWQDALMGFGAAMKDAGASLSGDYGAATNSQQYMQQLQQRRMYASLLPQLVGTPAPNGQMTATPNANGLDSFSNYSGGALPGPSADAIAPLLSRLTPQAGLPLALGMLQARIMPNFQKLGPGDNIFDVNHPGSGPIASAPPLPDFGKPYTAPGADGTLHQFSLNSKDGKPKDLGAAPQATALTPADYAQLGFDPATLPPNTVLQREPDGKITVVKASNLLSPAEIAQKGQISGLEEIARQNAQTGALRPANDPIVQSHVTNILNGNETEANVPAPLKNSVSFAMANTPKTAYAPLAATRFTNASNRITQNFLQLPQYQLTANGLPYLQRIDAAMKTPGSVSDQDLLDSIAKLNTAGNAITDAQVKIITDGQSYKDAYNVWQNKLHNGGVLSPNQRSQIQQIAKSVYANYQKGYQPVFDQVKKQYDEAGIPQAFRTMPDLNNLAAQGGLQPQAPGAGDALSQARAAIAQGADRNAVIQRLKQIGVDAGGL